MYAPWSHTVLSVKLYLYLQHYIKQQKLSEVKHFVHQFRTLDPINSSIRIINHLKVAAIQQRHIQHILIYKQSENGKIQGFYNIITKKNNKRFTKGKTNIYTKKMKWNVHMKRYLKHKWPII